MIYVRRQQQAIETPGAMPILRFLLGAVLLGILIFMGVCKYTCGSSAKSSNDAVENPKESTVENSKPGHRESAEIRLKITAPENIHDEVRRAARFVITDVCSEIVDEHSADVESARAVWDAGSLVISFQLRPQVTTFDDYNRPEMFAGKLASYRVHGDPGDGLGGTIATSDRMSAVLCGMSAKNAFAIRRVPGLSTVPR